MKSEKETERINQRIGIHAITGALLLVYIFWMRLEDVYTLACVTLMINLGWFVYSRRLLRIYTESNYSKNYTANYIICAVVGWTMYIVDVAMFYRNVIIFVVCCEGFSRTFLVEIRKLIKESKELES